jgi:hypothetical protein
MDTAELLGAGLLAVRLRQAVLTTPDLWVVREVGTFRDAE